MSRIKWRSREAREIVKMAEGHGLRVGLSARGHIRVFGDDNKVVMHTGSSLSPRNFNNAKAQIRRAVRKQKEAEA